MEGHCCQGWERVYPCSMQRSGGSFCMNEHFVFMIDDSLQCSSISPCYLDLFSLSPKLPMRVALMVLLDCRNSHAAESFLSITAYWLCTQPITEPRAEAASNSPNFRPPNSLHPPSNSPLHPNYRSGQCSSSVPPPPSRGALLPALSLSPSAHSPRPSCAVCDSSALTRPPSTYTPLSFPGHNWHTAHCPQQPDTEIHSMVVS